MESGTQKLIIIVDTVEGDIGLIAAGSIHRTGATIRGTGDVGAVAGKDNSRLQTEDSCGIAPLEGEIRNLTGLEGVTEGSVLRVDQRSCAGNIDRYNSARNLHRNVQSGGRSDQKLDAVLLHGAETCGFH